MREPTSNVCRKVCGLSAANCYVQGAIGSDRKLAFFPLARVGHRCLVDFDVLVFTRVLHREQSLAQCLYIDTHLPGCLVEHICCVCRTFVCGRISRRRKRRFCIHPGLHLFLGLGQRHTNIEFATRSDQRAKTLPATRTPFVCAKLP